MAFALFFLFLCVPLIEISLFVTVGGAIGLWPTLAIVVLTAVAGSAMVRAQGFRTWQKARASLDRGEMPVKELFDGLCIFAAGIALVTPGFFTDAIGILLLLPPVRMLIAARLARSMVVVQPGRGQGGWPGQEPGHGPTIIETEFHEVGDREDER